MFRPPSERGRGDCFRDSNPRVQKQLSTSGIRRRSYECARGVFAVIIEDNWILNLRQFLSYLESSRLPLDQVAPRFGFDLDVAKGIRERARAVATSQTGNGVSRHRLQEFEPDLGQAGEEAQCVLPRCPSKDFDLQVLHQIGVSIRDLSSEPQRSGLLQPGLDAYAHGVWSSRSYPVFSHDRTRQAARSFVNLLNALEIPLKAVRFISFDPRLHSEWPNKWREALGFSEKIKIEKRSEIFFGREDTRSWLEIRPTFSVSGEDEDDGVGIFGFRYAMVMAFILFGSEVCLLHTSKANCELLQRPTNRDWLEIRSSRGSESRCTLGKRKTHRIPAAADIS